MSEWLHANWPAVAAFFAGLGAGGGLLKWLFHREISHWERWRNDCETRLRQVEACQVTKDDFDELRTSMLSSIDLRYNALKDSVDALRGDLRDFRADMRGRKL